MCMCYEDNCRHKKLSAIPILQEKPKHEGIKINTSFYKETGGIVPNHFLRQKSNKLMFYTDRPDMPFAGLNMGKLFTLRHANYIIKTLGMDLEPITLKQLEKESRARKSVTINVQ